MRSVVVQDEMDLSTTGHAIQEFQELLMAVAGQLPITVPSSTFRAANKVVVPWRT